MNTLDARRRLLGRNVYKKTTEGNPAIAQGSLARRDPGIGMQGWTEQAQYEGNQLFDETLFNDLDGYNIHHYPVYVGEGTFTCSSNLPLTSTSIITNIFFLAGNVSSGESSKDNGVYQGRSVTVNSVDGYVTVAARESITENSNDPRNFDIMVNAGSTALPYEPYTGGQPSPSPDYPQEIGNAGNWNEETQKYEHGLKLTGANLFDREKAADTNNWVISTTQDGYSDFAIDVIPGQQITFSFPEKLQLGITMYVGIVSIEDGPITKWLYHGKQENLIAQKATITAITDKIWVRCNASSIETFVSGNPYFQVEYGEERTDFQPYKEQTVTLTSDRPLTKWDKLEKRNGQWGWVYKSAEIVLDGSEDETLGMGGVWIFFSNIKLFESSSANYNDVIYCDKLRKSIDSEEENIFKLSGAGYFEVTNIDVGGEFTPDNLKTWLAQNPLTVWYETAEETFVPLSETEQEQMNALHTNRPTTVLSNDVDCNMTLTYKTKKSMGGGVTLTD